MADILIFPFNNKSFEGELHIHRDSINGVLTKYIEKRKTLSKQGSHDCGIRLIILVGSFKNTLDIFYHAKKVNI